MNRNGLGYAGSGTVGLLMLAGFGALLYFTFTAYSKAIDVVASDFAG